MATLLFWSKGFEATSIVDLTHALGIEAPSLYAAFGSKAGLFRDAVQHYGDRYQGLVWDNFQTAKTAREATQAYLIDSAAALGGSIANVPRGCMVTLATLGRETHPELSGLVEAARAVTFHRLQARYVDAVAQGELAGSVDTAALARFIQSVQCGMSVLARDGATCPDLTTVARIALASWDEFTARVTNDSATDYQDPVPA